jgi:hypothetical protein
LAEPTSAVPAHVALGIPRPEEEPGVGTGGAVELVPRLLEERCQTRVVPLEPGQVLEHAERLPRAVQVRVQDPEGGAHRGAIVSRRPGRGRFPRRATVL